MRKLLVVLLIYPLSVKASTISQTQACRRLQVLDFQIAAHESNLANVNTTRTPEGGPYRFKLVKCSDIRCELKEEMKVRFTYQPDHPDASANGYVKFPDFDAAKEQQLNLRLEKRRERVEALCLGEAG